MEKRTTQNANSRNIARAADEMKRKQATLNSVRKKILGPSQHTYSRAVARDILADVSNRGKENSAAMNSSQSKGTLQPAVSSAVDDEDSEDSEDPVMMSEYISEIIIYMRELEAKVSPPMLYLDSKKEISWEMRSVLVNWLTEIQWKLKLLAETLFLTVNIVDRFLALRSVSVDKLQLLGLAATMIACKYEEIISPSVSNFTVLADGAYKNGDLLKAERYILHVLQHTLCFPSPMTFLRRLSKADNYDVRSRTISKYLLERALVEKCFVGLPGSLVAAGAIHTARVVLGTGGWTPRLAQYSGYSEEEVGGCTSLFHSVLSGSVKYRAAFDKYSTRRLFRVSQYLREFYRGALDRQTAGK